MDTVFNRFYLQSLPQKKKQELMDGIINGFSQELLSHAEQGKTSYMYETQRLDIYNNGRRIGSGGPPLIKLSLDDLADRIKQRFPDCIISYQETWIDQNINTRFLKKGIVIDWS
jgi:hypothetical protein